MTFDTSDNLSIERDAFLPVLLLALSLLLFFIFQINNVTEQRTALKTAIDRQDQVVKQSRQIQDLLKNVALDLLNAAKTDDNAKQIVTKYNIQQQPPPAPLCRLPEEERADFFLG